MTAFLADRFLGWLDRQGGEPWFAHVSFLKPHPPFVAAEPWYSAVAPAAVPPPVRAPTPEAEGALHPWLAAHLAQPIAGRTGASCSTATSLARLRAVYFGPDRRGRPPSWPHPRAAGTPRASWSGRLSCSPPTMARCWATTGCSARPGFFPQAFHVPLLIRHPDGVRGRRVDAFTEHVDLMPTILDALGLEMPRQCDGHSLCGLPCGRRAADMADGGPLGARFPRHRGRDLRAALGSAERRLQHRDPLRRPGRLRPFRRAARPRLHRRSALAHRPQPGPGLCRRDPGAGAGNAVLADARGRAAPHRLRPDGRRA